jgi:hypothetical protein
MVQRLRARKKEINIAINSIAATMIHSGSEDTTHAEVSFLTRGLCSQIKEDEEEEEEVTVGERQWSKEMG